MKGVCIDCGGATNRDSRAIYCWTCVKKGGKARVAVASAIRNGLIPKAKIFDCVDCGSPAEHYDHRDYNKPLEVDPVCRKCNSRRGPAIPLKEEPVLPRSKTLASAMRVKVEDWNRVDQVMRHIGRAGFMRFINREYRKIESRNENS